MPRIPLAKRMASDLHLDWQLGMKKDLLTAVVQLMLQVKEMVRDLRSDLVWENELPSVTGWAYHQATMPVAEKTRESVRECSADLAGSTSRIPSHVFCKHDFLNSKEGVGFYNSCRTRCTFDSLPHISGYDTDDRREFLVPETSRSIQRQSQVRRQRGRRKSVVESSFCLQCN